MADNTVPGAEAGAENLRAVANRIHSQIDPLHDVSALLLAIIDTEEDHSTRLARMAYNIVQQVRNEIDAQWLALVADVRVAP